MKTGNEKKATAQDKQPAVQDKQPTARERYRSRYAEAHPDMNLDDEEAFYGQANANLDELEGYRESNRQLGEAFDKSPLLAGLVLAAKEGENPFTYLAENIGPDMDIRELASNPDFDKKMGEALAKFQEKQAESAKAEKEIGNNMQKSFDALKELQQERGMSDEDCMEIVRSVFGEVGDDGEMTDPGLVGNLQKGIVPKEIWEAVVKARNYDSDLASASEKARAQALNEKEQNPKRSFNDVMPPSLNGNSQGAGERKARNDGSLQAFKESLGV